jgi:hypothetical protein
VLINRTTGIICIFATAYWLSRVLRRQVDNHGFLIITVIAALTASAQWLPELAVTVGWVDSVMLVFLVACGALIATGRVKSAAVIASIAILAHEVFVFYWIPLALLAFLQIRNGRLDATIYPPHLFVCIPFFVVAAIIVFENDAAARLEVLSIGLDAIEENELINSQLGQPIVPTLLGMAKLVAQGWRLFIWSLIVISGPAIVIALLYANSRSTTLNKRDRIIIVSSIFSPLAVLCLASDYSRFMAVTVLSIFITILNLETSHRFNIRTSAPVIFFSIFLAAVELQVPVFFVSPHIVTFWNQGPLFIVNNRFELIALP